MSDLKTFDDLEFKPHQVPMFAGHARMTFSNGWGVSVVHGQGALGGGVGYELAVMHDGDLHYDNPAADGDVCAGLTESEVTRLMAEVQEFKSSTEEKANEVE